MSDNTAVWLRNVKKMVEQNEKRGRAWAKKRQANAIVPSGTDEGNGEESKEQVCVCTVDGEKSEKTV